MPQYQMTIVTMEERRIEVTIAAARNASEAFTIGLIHTGIPEQHVLEGHVTEIKNLSLPRPLGEVDHEV